MATSNIRSKSVYLGPKGGPGKYFKAFVKAFGDTRKKEADKVMVASAKAIVAEVKDVIERQRYHWKPLSEMYRDMKIAKGLDERILIATGLYKRSIKWWKTTGGEVRFGVPRGIRTQEGVPLWLISKWLEFGTRKMPARPLWRPVLSSFGRRFRETQIQFYKALKRGMEYKMKAREG
jgi:hypothetical protein